jgi:hypothetical protein
MKENYYIHDFIEDYPEQLDPDIQWKTAAREEFHELRSKKGTEEIELGKFFRHQKIFARLMRIYDRLFIIHETGTGKTGSFINYALESKKYENKNIVVLQPGPPTVDDFKNQVGKFDPEGVLSKNYTVTTYQKFIKDDYSDDELIEKFSDTIFFLDEIHKLRNTELSDKSGDFVNPDQIEKIYNYLWRIFHSSKRIKVVISSATPMINTVYDFVPLINLLLPADRQLPEIRERGFYEGLGIEQLEPYFRGIISFVRFPESDVEIVRPGEILKNYQQSLDVNKTRSVKEIKPITKEYVDGSLRVSDQTKKNNSVAGQFKTKQIEEKKNSQTVVYPVEMRGLQLKVYQKTEEDRKKDSFQRNQRQSSVMVFPNGMYGTNGFKFYVTKDDFGDYKFKNNIIYRGKSYSGMKKYIDSKNIPKTLKNLEQLSCKFTDYLKREIDQSKKERPGNSFCYLELVEGSGVIVLGLILELLGFENFRSNSMTLVNSETNKIAPDFKKKRRFALITGKTTNLRSILRVFNSPDNMDGEYIQMIIASEVARDGINIKNVLRGYILSPGWHESGMYQALSRFIRADSHQDMVTRRSSEGIEDKLKVDIYKFASVKSMDELSETDSEKMSVDLVNYLVAEKKDMYIKRVLRIMKQVSIDSYMNYERNFRSSDVSYSQEADYSENKPGIWNPIPDRKRGPGKKNLVYNTYNLFYSDEYDKEIWKILSREFVVRGRRGINFIPIEKCIQLIRDGLNFSGDGLNDYIVYQFINNYISQRKPYKDTFGINDYNFKVVGNNLMVEKRVLYNYNNYLPTELDYVFRYKKDTVIDMTESDDKKIEKLYSDLEKLNLTQVINYYSIKQNYRDFKLLLERSLVSYSKDETNDVDRKILELFYNYFLKTRIPENWLEVTREALKPVKEKKQGRKRADGSTAGLKSLDLSKYSPGFSREETFVHFYRESETSGFGITSILEGKDRKIRILEGDAFRDTDIAEKFVYTYLFDREYEKLLERFKKSRFYGSKIYRGGEQEKNIVSRRKEFFRIVDTSFNRNTGRVCVNKKTEDIQEVLREVDTEGRYKQYHTGKIRNKEEICNIIYNIFREKDLLFVSM